MSTIDTTVDERRIEQRITTQIQCDRQPTVEEWLTYLKAGHTVKVLPKTDNYADPYYVYFDATDDPDKGNVVSERGGSIARHEVGELYLRTLLGYYEPQPVDEGGEQSC